MCELNLNACTPQKSRNREICASNDDSMEVPSIWSQIRDFKCKTRVGSLPKVLTSSPGIELVSSEVKSTSFTITFSPFRLLLMVTYNC